LETCPTEILASRSASSFPLIPLWLGIHLRFRCMWCLSLVKRAMSLIFWMICESGFLRGLARACSPARESVDGVRSAFRGWGGPLLVYGQNHRIVYGNQFRTGDVPFPVWLYVLYLWRPALPPPLQGSHPLPSHPCRSRWLGLASPLAPLPMPFSGPYRHKSEQMVTPAMAGSGTCRWIPSSPAGLH